MRNAALVSVLTTTMLGCAARPVTKLDCEKFTLSVSGRAKSIEEVSAIDHREGVSLSLDTHPGQVDIKVKLLEARSHRNLSLWSTYWLTEDGKIISPNLIIDTTPPPPSISFGVGFIVGVGVTIPLESSNQISSIEAQFNLEGTIRIDTSCLVLELRDKNAHGRILLQPVVVPLKTLPKPRHGDDPIEVPATTFVIAGKENTLRIGGRQMSETEMKSKVPLLNDLPTIGRLFKDEEKVKFNDPIIFVTPRILLTEED